MLGASRSFQEIGKPMTSRALIRQLGLLVSCLATATVVLGLYGDALNVDASSFLVVGRGWIAGTSPYAGLWDHKPPGEYFVTAIAALIDPHGDGVLALRALSICFVVATALAVDGIVRRLTGRIDAGVASALLVTVLLASPALSEGGGLTELFATTGMAVALLGVIEAGSGSRSAALIAGAGLGWAVSCSLLALGMLPALAYAWLSTGIEPSGAGASSAGPKAMLSRLKPASLAWLMAGGILVSAACWVPAIVSGSFGAALDAVVGYSALYRSMASLSPGPWLVWLIILSPFWLPAILLIGLVRRDAGLQLTRIAAVWIVGGLCWLIYGERLYPHYLLVLAVPLAMLTVSGALGCLKMRLPRTGRLTLVAYAALVAVGIVGLLVSGPGDPSSEARTNRDVASYIDQRSVSSDRIYVWGISSDIYLSADRMPDGRFFYLLPLMTPGFGETAAGEMLAKWQKDPPLFIVDASSRTVSHDALASLLVDHPITSPDSRTDSTSLNGLRSFVRQRYELAVVIGDKRVYRLQT
jgi:hypothetical protein